MVRWPERETLKQTLPAVFKFHFPRLTGIMDCFEIFIDRPKNLEARAQVYSNYKKHSTVKVFIVCSPLGAVTYLSTAWGGRASDVEMVHASDFISSKYHQPHDQLLADHGFTMVEEFVVTCGAEWLIPSFTKGKKQLSPKEVEISRNISTIRIHIERDICLLKNQFTILQGPPSINLTKSQKDETNQSNLAAIDKLVHVCAALINMTDGIVYNDKSWTLREVTMQTAYLYFYLKTWKIKAASIMHVIVLCLPTQRTKPTAFGHSFHTHTSEVKLLAMGAVMCITPNYVIVQVTVIGRHLTTAIQFFWHCLSDSKWIRLHVTCQ